MASAKRSRGAVGVGGRYPTASPGMGYDAWVVDDGRASDPLRTALAAKGVELSALFFVVFEETELPGTPPRQPRLMAPPGPSTGGGKMARQHVTLVPVDDQDGPSVVAGWVDSSTKRCELRSWGTLADRHQQRRGKKLDIPKGAYGRFAREAAAFFKEQGFTMVAAARQSSQAARRGSGTGWGLWLLVLLITFVLGIGIGVFWMLNNRGAIFPTSP